MRRTGVWKGTRGALWAAGQAFLQRRDKLPVRGGGCYQPGAGLAGPQPELCGEPSPGPRPAELGTGSFVGLPWPSLPAPVPRAQKPIERSETSG